MCQIGAQIWLVLLATGSFLLFATQHFLGYFTGCIAIKAYSYHVLSDTLSLFVGLISYMVRQSPTAILSNQDDKSPVRNTYGWVRVELVGSLMGHVSIISLCFSCALDSLQYLFQPDDRLHYHCRMMLAMGSLGIVVHLSVIFYSFMFRCCISPPGASMSGLGPSESDVTVDTHVLPSSKLSTSTPISASSYNSTCLSILHQIISNEKAGNQIDFRAMLLHIGIGLLAAIMIVIDALVHFFIDHHDHKWIHYVDPCLAIIIIGIIIGNILPLIIQNAFILILNIPKDVDVIALQKQLMNEIPQIVQVHDIHVWRLEGKKIIATIHAVFEGVENEQHFTKISKKMVACFHKWDIHSLTFQPEFESPFTKTSVSAESFDLGHQMSQSNTIMSTDCLYKCSSSKCAKDTCCRSPANRCLTRIENNILHHMASQSHITHCSNIDLNDEAKGEEGEAEVLEHLLTGVV